MLAVSSCNVTACRCSSVARCFGTCHQTEISICCTQTAGVVLKRQIMRSTCAAIADVHRASKQREQPSMQRLLTLEFEHGYSQKML